MLDQLELKQHYNDCLREAGQELRYRQLLVQRSYPYRSVLTQVAEQLIKIGQQLKTHQIIAEPHVEVKQLAQGEA